MVTLTLLTLWVALLAICCIPAVRAWHGGPWLEFMRFFGTLGIFRGRFADAYAAAVIRFVLGGTTLFAGILGFLWWERLHSHNAFALAASLAVMFVGVAVVGIAACIYLFMRPRALIPPSLRNASGVFSTQTRSRRSVE